MTPTVDDLVHDLSRYLDDDTPATTMPPLVFGSPDLYALESRRIFARNWIAVGRTESLPHPGDSLSLALAERLVHVARGDDGRLVASGTFRVDTWQGFVFVNLDPDAAPLADRVDGLDELLPAAGYADSFSVPFLDEVWTVNWKLVMENGVETYHHMGVHPTTVNPFVPSSGNTYVQAHTPSWVDLRSAMLEPGNGEPGEQTMITVFPTLQVIPTGNLTTWNTVLPLAHDRSRVLAGFLLDPADLDDTDPEALRATLAAMGAAFAAEDRAVGEAIQRVVTSRYADRSPLSTKEPALPHLYRYLARSLS